MGRSSRTTGLADRLHLFGRFLRDPRTVGAIAPSSRALARAMIDGLDLASARVVELGPGTGSLTGAIVEAAGAGGKFLAIDVDASFVEALRAKWPGIEVVCASAERLDGLAEERGLLPVDHILSGLPFASLPRDVTRGILDGIERALAPGGTFTTFQYVQAYGMAAAVNFRRDIGQRLGAEPSKRLVIRNTPPAWVLRWTKRRAAAKQ